MEIGFPPGGRANGAGDIVFIYVHVDCIRFLGAAGRGPARQRQLTPRVIAIVFKDPVTKFSLAAFVFAFTFTLAALVRIEDFVPLVTSDVAAYGCVASLGVFLYLIDHMGKALRPSGACGPSPHWAEG